jgi:single-strand DNA-binding protein
MNHVTLIGRLTRDPELRYAQSGKAFCTFTLAVDRRFSKQNNNQPTADFIPCVAWDKLAEIIGNNLAKGRKVGVEGRLQTRTYEAKDGSKRSAFDVMVDELEFLDPKGQHNQGNQEAPQQGQPSQQDWTEEVPF